jgi:hypothetical protein
MKNALRKRLLLVTIACIACFASTASTASTASAAEAPAAVAHDGQHDFDDSFGSWKVQISRLLHPLSGSAEWVQYQGTHTITPIWGGRANVGVLDATGPAGRIEAMSPRLYNPATHQWSVRYASSRDGAMGVPHVGQFKDGRGVFIAQDSLGDKVILVRNIYWADSADLHRFEVEYSDDGGASWETNWKMTEIRMTQ